MSRACRKPRRARRRAPSGSTSAPSGVAHDEAKPLEFEVDEAERLVDPDADRRAPASIGATELHASASVGASSTSDTVMP